MDYGITCPMHQHKLNYQNNRDKVVIMDSLQSAYTHTAHTWAFFALHGILTKEEIADLSYEDKNINENRAMPLMDFSEIAELYNIVSVANMRENSCGAQSFNIFTPSTLSVSCHHLKRT